MAIQTNEDGDKLWGIYRRDSTDVQVKEGAVQYF